MRKDNHALTTGLFLVVLLCSVIAVIYWMGHFERERNRYVIETKESVSGLNPESTVFYRGIAVGKVIKVAFDPKDSGIILVPIEVDKNIVLSKGVYATLRLKGVTGLTQIQLEDSGGINEELPPGDDPILRIPLKPSMTDKLLNSGEDLLKKADHLMLRLSALLTDENEKNIGSILVNLKGLSDKLASLQKGLDNALADLPVLTKEARQTMAHINTLSGDASKTLSNVSALTQDLQRLTQAVQSLSLKAAAFVDSGKHSGDQLTQTTLPKVNQLLQDLQSATLQIKRLSATLENDPQALFRGSAKELGPGEAGYQAP